MPSRVVRNLLHPSLIASTVHTYDECPAIAQTDSRLLPTAAAPVRFQVRSCGICGGQSGTGAGFLRVIRFHLSSGATTIGQIVADIPSRLSLTLPQEKKKEKRSYDERYESWDSCDGFSKCAVNKQY
jgi:hypothetical protein